MSQGNFKYLLGRYARHIQFLYWLWECDDRQKFQIVKYF